MLAIFEGLKRGYVIYVLNYCSHRKKTKWANYSYNSNSTRIFVKVFSYMPSIHCCEYSDSRKNWMLKYKSYNFNVFILKRLNFSCNMTFPIKITKGGELNKESVISKSKEEVTLDIQLYINICSSLSRRITHDIAFELF